MVYRVTLVPSGHSFETVGEANLLDTALDAGFHLLYSCRNGACGACKGRVVAGQVERGRYQESALTAEELRQGYVLLCSTRPLSDVTIECREVGGLRDIPVKTLPCRVQNLEHLAPDVMLMELKLPDNERLQFLPGQHIDILLKDGRRRSFSLVNAPHDDELLQLHVRLVPGGRFTEHVFHGMKERDILRLEGPLGSFFLQEESNKPIVFVAGGTGFAPIKAMIEHALHQGSKRSMTLYWGARDRSGLYLDAWAARGLGYVPVLSEPRPEDAWTGRIGLVHRAVMADLPDLSGHQAYVCGAPAMVEAARHDFVQICGLPVGEFRSDAFFYSAESVSA